MSLKSTLVVSALALSFAASASADHCINKDLINLGPTAYDLGVVITGAQPLTWRYDGYPNAKFTKFTAVPAGPNTFLHWRNLNGSDAPILLGDLIHVGWCVKNPFNIVDMFWTTLAGGRVPGSVVYNLTSGITFNGGRRRLVLRHQFQTGNPMVVSNIHIAVASAPFPLAELNRENETLAAQFAPLPGGQSVSIPPGGTVEIDLPPYVTAGQHLVLRYSVDGPGNASQSLDFYQLPVEDVIQP
ncbi:MAG TPA: hypothetical protein VFR31_20830 [Thermoanaerobaculia bacterium]|nr:hypothetical protein [Thermoanaerobaculia bacterium]